MDANATVSIYSSPNLVDAQIVRNALEEEGIPCQIDSINQGGYVGVVDIHLLVHAADVERAKQLIEEYEELHAAKAEEEEEADEPEGEAEKVVDEPA